MIGRRNTVPYLDRCKFHKCNDNPCIPGSLRHCMFSPYNCILQMLFCEGSGYRSSGILHCLGLSRLNMFYDNLYIPYCQNSIYPDMLNIHLTRWMCIRNRETCITCTSRRFPRSLSCINIYLFSFLYFIPDHKKDISLTINPYTLNIMESKACRHRPNY